jgi:cysteine desulfurase
MMARERKIYLDYNATTPMLPVAKEAVLQLMDKAYNPSSTHACGREAKAILEQARKSVRNAIGADDDRYQVVFTASGTESNNIALNSFPHTIASCIEHPSILQIIGQGVLPVDNNGVVILEDAEKIIAQAKSPFLVSVMAANNEVGTIQPIKELAALTHKYGGKFHTDASQAIGKIPFSADEVGADLITVTSHKLGGGAGAAALVFDKSIDIKPIMRGGGQEFRYRPGTQNVAAIAGFASACDNIHRYFKADNIADMRNQLESKILHYAPDALVLAGAVKRLPNTSCIYMPGVASETQVMHFDLKGIALSAGSACSSGKISLPHVPMSMGLSEAMARQTIRVSLGFYTTQEDIAEFVKAWIELYDNNKSKLENI